MASLDRMLRAMHVHGPLDKYSLTYPCSCGGRWHMGVRGPYHVDPPESTNSGDVPAFGVYSGQGDEA